MIELFVLSGLVGTLFVFFDVGELVEQCLWLLVVFVFGAVLVVARECERLFVEFVVIEAICCSEVVKTVVLRVVLYDLCSLLTVMVVVGVVVCDLLLELVECDELGVFVVDVGACLLCLIENLFDFLCLEVGLVILVLVECLLEEVVEVVVFVQFVLVCFCVVVDLGLLFVKVDHV